MTDRYEAFCDASYYDMWCVRRFGVRTFGQGFHVLNEKSALELKGKLEALAAENARLTALVHTQGEEAAGLRAERDALLEVDRLAEIASSWHWWNATKCCDYEDKDDLFQDMDEARAKALTLKETPNG